MSTPALQPGLPVIVRLEIRTPKGGGGALLDFLREAIPFYEAPGGIRVRLLQRIDDPDSFIEEIEYRSPSEYETDSLRVDSDPEMKHYLDRWRSLLDGKAEVTVYQDRTSEVAGGKRMK